MADKKETTEKVVTKYDKKIEDRRIKEAKDKRDKKITTIVTTAIIVLIVAAIGISIGLGVSKKNKAISSPYIKVGDYEVTKVEYDFYYNTIINNYVNTYGSMMSYFGLDVTGTLETQHYSDDMTWKDFFDKSTVEQIKDVKACKDDAEKAGFEYDTDELYDSFKDGLSKAAKEKGVTVDQYYKDTFGEYANEKNLEACIRENIYVDGYLSSLVKENVPTDEEIATYYEENKETYDSGNYGSQEDINSAISNTLASKAVNEYKEKLTESYPVTDVAGELSAVVLE